jgi:hypothetical protein
MKRALVPTAVLLAAAAGAFFFFLPSSTMELTSSAFSAGGVIPARFTCDGDDVSPPLSWADIPEGTKSFALLVHDPDAPSGDFVHWLVSDIPAGTSEIPENGPVPGVERTNDFSKTAWGGPCPPSGEHRYVFVLYALDAESLPGVTKETLAQALEGHVLGSAELVGRYRRTE